MNVIEKLGCVCLLIVLYFFNEKIVFPFIDHMIEKIKKGRGDIKDE